ncbi:MAG: hypothetical protein BWY78_00618 [Alphaproteobacteria bacterium ADurb.Bin438]|nr:MAG: hypothetical protein BWY78_00618 [Alphaproteobacteria bacterium ADurb.Bin438]
MKKILFYFILLMLQINPSYAKDWERIAFSKKYRLEIFVEGEKSSWCDAIVHLKVVVNDDDFINSNDFKDNISKALKKVVEEKECPRADIAGVKVFNRKLDEIDNFVAIKEDGWQIHKAKENRTNISEDYEITDDFKVSGWSPKNNDEVVVTSNNVFEHEIKTKDKKCAIRYSLNKPSSKMNKWYMVVEGNKCKDYYLNGKARINIYNERGRIVSKGAGYFSKGYFTDDKIFDVKFLERYAYGIENQRLSYLVDSDAINKIHYISYLKSEYRKKYDKYTKWHGCDPFVISAVTDNYLMFLEDKDINDIIDAAKDYASAYCPDALVMKVFGTKKPSEVYGVDIPLINLDDDDSWKFDPDFYFGATINRNPLTGAWVYDDKKSKNRIRYDEIIRQADNIVVKDDLSTEYYNLLKGSYAKKLAYMFDVENLDNLNAFILASQLNDNASVYVNVMVNVASSDGISSKSYYPVPMVNKIVGDMLKTEGWYVAGGYISALSEEEKEFHGFKKDEFAAKFIPEKSMKCKNSFCSEVKNVLNLVQWKHKKFDFIPERQQ